MPVSSRLVPAAFAALCFALPGCVTVNGADTASMREDSWGGSTVKRNATLEIAHAAGSPVSVETANGSIEVVKGGGSQVEVSAEIRARDEARLGQVVLRAERGNGELKVWVEWPEGRRLNNEGASLMVRVPDASIVRAETSNGAVRVEDVGTSADLRTSNGSVRALRVAGPVEARTSNGKIVIEDAAGDAKARTSNGSIDVRGVKGRADLESSNGSIELRVAAGGAPFRVSTSNASVQVDLPASFAGEISASTSNGSVRLDDGKGEVKSRDSLTRVIGAGGEKSRVSTSNGSVTVRVAK